MKIISADKFMSRTMGGRPVKAKMFVYEGKKFQCGCGSEHSFDEMENEVLRELPQMHFVIACPNKEYVNCVKISLFSKLKTKFSAKFESEE